jgi:thiamine pyrophosphokinase
MYKFGLEMCKIINIKSKIFSAVLCLNADLPEIGIFEKIKGIPLFAADGAADKLFELNISPDYIIGDLDSFSIDLYTNKIPLSRIIHISEQDTNDFEKNLKYAMNLGYKDILIVGFHGGELEHTLNNWSVFKRFSKIINLCIFDRNRYGFTIDSCVEIPVHENEIISLIPQPTALLKTHNLKWELDNEVLELGTREGARNIALSNSININVLSGEILLFIDSKLPYCPVCS